MVVAVVVAAYSLVQCDSRVCHLADVWGFKYSKLKKGRMIREKTSTGDMLRMQFMIPGANKLMEWGELHLSPCNFGDIRTI